MTSLCGFGSGRAAVMSAIKAAIPTLVFSAITDAATTQQEINKKNKNKNIRMYHPWSSLTDGGIYDLFSTEIKMLNQSSTVLIRKP